MRYGPAPNGGRSCNSSNREGSRPGSPGENRGVPATSEVPARRGRVTPASGRTPTRRPGRQTRIPRSRPPRARLRRARPDHSRVRARSARGAAALLHSRESTLLDATRADRHARERSEAPGRVACGFGAAQSRSSTRLHTT